MVELVPPKRRSKIKTINLQANIPNPAEYANVNIQTGSSFLKPTETSQNIPVCSPSQSNVSPNDSAKSANGKKCKLKQKKVKKRTYFDDRLAFSDVSESENEHQTDPAASAA